MINKITDPKAFTKMLQDIAIKFGDEIQKYGHIDAPINIESFCKAWADARLLAFNLHVWANEENGVYDSTIMFQGIENPITGKKLWSEYFFVSKNPRATIKLQKEAFAYGKKLGYKKVVMHKTMNYPNSEKLVRFYKERLGLQKDSESFIGSL